MSSVQVFFRICMPLTYYDTYVILGVQLVVVLKCFICKDPLNSESVQMEPNGPTDPFGSICTLSELQTWYGHSELALLFVCFW